VTPLRRRLTDAIAMAGMRPPLRISNGTRISLRGKRVLITGASSGIGEAGAE
jgi:NADPH:quinone reductase-like Zn-dependent oxidoreductase